MFYVLGPGGPIYRAHANELPALAPVRSVQRPQALRSSEFSRPTYTAGAATTLPRPTQQALEAYASTEKGPELPRQPLERVRDVMTWGALTVRDDMRISEAWHFLAEHRIAQAPVVNAQGQVVGLLLRADMEPRELLPPPEAEPSTEALAQRLVHELMISPVPSVAPETGLRQLASALLHTGLPGLAVTDEQGHAAGFVSRTDILRAVAADPPLDLWS